jgi:cell division GTPase FtsZ
MKPADRSLEIDAIGLGQAGGNIAAELQRRGYRALAFNTASTDLSSLGASRLALPDSQRIYIGLEGFDGAGSDADYGRECITAHADAIRAAVQEHTAGADVVLLAAGLGGGTGSCAAEFCKVIEDLALPIVIVTTLPHGYESGIAKVNALCGVRDLATTPSGGWVLIDNARLAKLHRGASIGTYFETINRAIVEPLDIFNRLNERESTHAIRTLDGEDFRTLLLAGGVLNYATATLPKLAADGVVEAVRGSLADNPMMPTGGSLADVSYLGLVIEASERALAESPFSLYEEVAEQLKRETGGAAVYVGLYRQLASDDASATLRVIATSHALPGAIDAMLAEAEHEAGTIQEKMQRSMPAPDADRLDRLRLGRRRVTRGGRPAPSAPAKAEPAGEDGPAAKPARPMLKVSPMAPVAAQAAAVASPAPMPQPTPAPQVAPAPQARPKTDAASAPAVRSAPEAKATRSAAEAKAPRSAPETKPSTRAPEAKAAASPAVAKKPQSSNVEELRRMVAAAPATAATTPEAPAVGGPSRGRYERLANAFAEAKGEDKRLYIARELVAAQRSGEALERFYAVNAMVRVDPAYFREALGNAVKDSDPHVADLARRAIEKLSG